VVVIAEFKRASPTAGVFVEDADPAKWAAEYAANGAAALSVLIDRKFFHGSLQDMVDARGAADLPVICKEFILSPYQIYDAAAAGADAVLLIVGLTPEQELERNLVLVHELGMEALVEAHVEEEVEQALVSGARIVGINNRDLRSFKTDLAVTERLCAMIPDDITTVSESGVRTPADVERLAASGVSAVLVGESIMTAPDAGAQLRRLVAAG
jgi:indole-3-glycerol phosphate synthase